MSKRSWWFLEPTGSQWVAFSAAWIGWVLDAFDFTIFLIVMPEMIREFGVSSTAAATSITLTLLLRLAGGLLAGSMADKWGRRLPLLLSVIWFALCDGAVAFAPSFTWIVVLRTIFGLGMGAEWTSGATLAMENWPERSRGIASGILQGSWAIGYLLAGIAAAYVVPHWGWRALFIVAAVPALLAFPIRALVKEGAEWKSAAAAKRTTIWQDLAQFRLGGRLFWAISVEALGFAAYYGLTSLYATLLKTQLALTGADVARLVAWFNVGMMAGAVACGILTSKRGAALAIALPVLLTIPVVPLYVGYVPSLLTLGAFLGGAFGAGYCGVTPFLMHGLFPAKVRARCTGLVYHEGAFLAAFVPPGLTSISSRGSLSLGAAIAIVVASADLVMLVALLFRPREVTDAVRQEPAMAA